MINKVNQTAYALIFKELLEGPLTARDAIELTGLHIQTANNLFKCFKKHKIVYIASWETDNMGREVLPVYQIGNKPDKKRRVMTSTQRSARYKAKQAALKLINLTTNPQGASA
jgi:hypothetical protein